MSGQVKFIWKDHLTLQDSKFYTPVNFKRKFKLTLWYLYTSKLPLVGIINFLFTSYTSGFLWLAMYVSYQYLCGYCKFKQQWGYAAATPTGATPLCSTWKYPQRTLTAPTCSSYHGVCCIYEINNRSGCVVFLIGHIHKIFIVIANEHDEGYKHFILSTLQLTFREFVNSCTWDIFIWDTAILRFKKYDLMLYWITV